jgi:two-component system chemotaxis sensor kinase CheA
MQGGEIDLGIFRDAFFDEATEHVADIESALLELEDNREDRELLNRIFRGAHSIKGGSGTFGLTDVTRFTHALESLLDPLRQGTRQLDGALANLLLRATDVLKSLLIAARTGAAADPEMEQVLEALERAIHAEPAEAAAAAPASAPSAPSGPAQRVYRVRFEPHAEIFAQGMDPVLLLRNLYALGQTADLALDDSALPALSELDPERCYLGWTLTLTSDKSERELRDVFAFVEDASKIEIEDTTKALAEDAPPATTPERPNLVPERAAAAAEPGGAPHSAPASSKKVADAPDSAPASSKKTADMPPKSGAQERQGTPASTLRVSTDKIDRLMNLVGELVIAQSMITQTLKDPSGASLVRLGEAAVEMERNTRELQDLVMSVRMVPMGTVFNRFPRLVRDLAVLCHKQIRLEIEGQETEIDKGVIEQIADPLTHLIRNAIDHGLEPPEERLAAGKSASGTVWLSALHQGGSVIIEVRDDGRGLNKERILAKAISTGLVRADAELSDEQIHALIFEPGLSTASAVTDLSGRGVGMDVVRRNVDALGGSLSVTTEAGNGTRVRIRMPLTLAILDGLSLRLGQQTFVLPLLSIAESFRPRRDQVKTVFGRGEVVLVRGEPIPLVRLYDVLNVVAETTDPCAALVVIVETGATKIGLLVDELLGQAQVVVKSLETHYRKVDGLMGATILGDGKVALILDTEGLGRRALANSRTHTSNGEPSSRRNSPRAQTRNNQGSPGWTNAQQ